MGCGIVPWASVLCELMTPDPCYSKAVDMQRCLKANRYQEGVCFGSMALMEKCCSRWKERSPCCLTYERLRPQHQSNHAHSEKFNQDAHFLLTELFLSH